jgi:hypothetical protein
MGRRLTEEARREWFEPACEDLRHERLARGKPLDSLGYRIRVWLLAMECRRLHALQHTPPDGAPPKERLSMLIYYLRHAFRLLVREPGFTLAAVLTLAVGVGANIAVFAVVEAVLLRPLPYPDADRLVILRHRDRHTGISKEFIAIGDYLDLATRQQTFSGLNAYGTMRGTITGIGEPYRAPGLQAGSGLLETLGARPALGRTFTIADTRPDAAPVAMLSHELWQKMFRERPGSDRARRADRQDRPPDCGRGSGGLPVSAERAYGDYRAAENAGERSGGSQVHVDLRSGTVAARHYGRAGGRGTTRAFAAHGAGVSTQQSGV